MKYKCENCDHTDEGKSFDTLADPWARFEVGDLFTDKQCPECGGCSFPTDDPVVNLRYAAPELLSALQTCELELTALRQRLEGPEFAVIRTVILTALHQTRDAIAKATTNS